MIRILKSNDRGMTRSPGVRCRHAFSSNNGGELIGKGFRSLRTIDEYRVDSGHGLGAVPHNDMLILSFIYAGALVHADSIGNRLRIETGEAQLLCAGTGVRHSEQNDTDHELHFLQVWISPDQKGLEPFHDKAKFPKQCRHNALQLLASPQGGENCLRLQQDVNIYATCLDAGQAMELAPDKGRHLWLQLIDGDLKLGEKNLLQAGDGAAISGEDASLWLSAEKTDADLLIFDLA